MEDTVHNTLASLFFGWLTHAIGPGHFDRSRHSSCVLPAEYNQYVIISVVRDRSRFGEEKARHDVRPSGVVSLCLDKRICFHSTV